jgi:peptide/nickel transport system substrate-binding protein
MRRRAWIWLVALAMGAVVLSATGFAGPAQKKGGTLRLGFPFDLDSVDPAIGYGDVGWMLEQATCAKLYNYPDKPAPEDVIAMPEVATGFPKLSADGKTQTIELRRTYRFHTGQPVTAANFVAAFNRDASPKLQSPATNYLHEIVGADAVVAGRAQVVSGVKAVARYTIQIRTTRPLPDLVSRLTMPFFCPIAASTPLQEIDDPPGSGPYYIAARVPNRQIVLERNRFYRGSRPANVDRMVVSIGVGREACRQAVEHDELDYCTNLPPVDFAEIAAKYGINRKDGQFFVNPTLALTFFAFNHDRPAFKGPGQIPLAKAINWAIDRPALVRAVGYLAGKRTDQILPPAMTRPASIYPLGGVTRRSLARARALLKQATFKPSKLVVYTDNFSYHSAWAQIFQFNLRRLGIDVEIKVFPRAGYFSAVGIRGAAFDIAVAGGWIPDYADPVTIFGPLLDGHNIAQSGNTNIAYFDQPQYNREVERAETLTGEARRKAWADLDVEMMRNDPPWAPVLTLTEADFASRSFGCFVFQPAIGPDFAAACKK